MERIIYCLNLFENYHKLLKNIHFINNNFNFPDIFIASNGISDAPNLSSNCHFLYWGKNQGWQLGALNSTLQALQFAAKYQDSFDNTTVIFSHDDVYPIAPAKIQSFTKNLTMVDMVVRQFIGHGVDHDYPYYMLEDIIMSGNTLKRFTEVPVFTEVYNNCAEQTFGHYCTRLGIKTMAIPILKNTELIENELGFYHDHKH